MRQFASYPDRPSSVAEVKRLARIQGFKTALSRQMIPYGLGNVEYSLNGVPVSGTSLPALDTLASYVTAMNELLGKYHTSKVDPNQAGVSGLGFDPSVLNEYYSPISGEVPDSLSLHPFTGISETNPYALIIGASKGDEINAIGVFRQEIKPVVGVVGQMVIQPGEGRLRQQFATPVFSKTSGIEFHDMLAGAHDNTQPLPDNIPSIELTRALTYRAITTPAYTLRYRR